MAVIATISGEKKITAIDEAGAGVTYIGFAKLGSATSSTVWQIFKIAESGAQTMITYADGNSNYDNEWDERASYSYS